VVVGYLTAFLLKGGKRLGDRALDALLNNLVERVQRKLGPRPLNVLNQNPGNPQSERLVGEGIDQAMRVDPQFAADIAYLVESLNRRNGQYFVNQVYGGISAVSTGSGPAIGYYAPPPPDPSDISDAPAWVKLFVVLGAVLCFAGVALFGYGMFNWTSEPSSPDFKEFPPEVVGGAALFLVGLVVLAIAGIGRSMSRRPTRHPW
jgi:hypothetical protein